MDYKTKPELDENLLEHFGVKGMRWGVRRDTTSAAGKVRDARKAEKLKQRYARDDAIDAARARVASGAVRTEYKAARHEYKAQRKVVGRKEARRIMKEKRRALNNEYALSQQLKSGRERTTYILTAAGLAVVGGAAKGAITYNQNRL